MNKIFTFENNEIYLASPDILSNMADRLMSEKVALCEKYGFIGNAPKRMEFEDDNKKGTWKQALAIKQENLDQIRKSSIMIADLNWFRGFEPEGATCMAIGYAEALDKVIFGYYDGYNKSLRQNYTLFKRHGQYGDYVFREWGLDGNDTMDADEANYSLEDYNLPLSLMISSKDIPIEITLEECLRELKELYEAYQSYQQNLLKGPAEPPKILIKKSL